MKKTLSRRIISFLLVLMMVVAFVPEATDASAASYTMQKQTDGKWANYSYKGGALSTTGSGIFALANAIGFVNGNQMNVTTVASWAANNGHYNETASSGIKQSTFFYNAGKNYGSTYSFSVNCGSENTGFFTDAGSSLLKAHLAKGNTAVAHVKDHFVALVGYDLDTNSFRVWDSEPNANRGTLAGNVWLKESVLLTNEYMTVDWYCLISDATTESVPVNAAFDPMVYRYRNQDISGIDTMTTADLKAHWLSEGIKAGRVSSVVLDLKYYVENNPDVKNSFGTDYAKAYNHFLTDGYKQSRSFSETYANWYYCDFNEDVNDAVGVAGCMNHFLNSGIKEDRRYSSSFNANYYWYLRPDVERTWPGNYEMCLMYYASVGIKDNVVSVDNEGPVVSDIKITNLSTLGYTISCKVTDNWGVSKVSFPVWTEKNGQDDLAANFLNTQLGTRDDDIFYFRVNSSAHNNETGNYITHIYAYDHAGNRTQYVCNVTNVKGSTSEQIVISSSSSLSVEGPFVKNVKPSTTVNALTSEFANSTLSVTNKDGTAITGKTFVGTGSKIKLYSSSTLRDERVVIVLGDIDGDGKLNTTDFIMLKANFLGVYDLDTYQKISADVDNSNAVTTTDYMKIKEQLIYGDIYAPVGEKPDIDFGTSLTVKEQAGNTGVVTHSGLVYSAKGYNSYSNNAFTVNQNFVMDLGEEFPDKFNRLTLCYVASAPMKCTVTYRIAGETVKDLFYLEAGENTFCALIQGYLEGNRATKLTSISVSTCEGKDATFALCDVKTEVYTVYNGETHYIENNNYKLGICLKWGGGISELIDKNVSISGLYNLINRGDTGRLIQQSYYGTDNHNDNRYTNGTYAPDGVNYVDWGYNPVQGGDKGNNHSRLIDVVVGNNSVYIKAQPLDWGHVLSFTPSYMENVYALEDEFVRVDNRFIDFSGYSHFHRDQELPAFYTLSYLDSFSYYNGSSSWTNDAITTEPNLPFWGGAQHNSCLFPMKKSNTETWCAWTNSKSGYGIGLFVPNVDMFLAGRHNYTGTTDPKGPTNYVAPIKFMMIVAYEPIEYSYLVTTGTLSDIRNTFNENKDFETNESLNNNSVSLRVDD